MKLNANKKRKAAKEQVRADQGQKWCSEPGVLFGYHGNYTGRRCPKCVEHVAADVERRGR
jgi:hypothetical protein